MSNNSHQSGQIWPPLQFNQISPAELIGEGFLFTEGPVWNREEGYLLFSDISGDTIYRWVLPDTLEVLRRPSHNANGLAYDKHGRLLAAEHGARRVSCLKPDGSLETLVDNYQGRKFHSPNDIAVRSDNTIYFTDPPYGLGRRPPELPFMGLYRIDPDGEIHLEGEYYQCPNGLAFSPDEKTLYLALTEADEVVAMDVADDGSTSHVRSFAPVPYPDGIAVDLAGNIYVSGGDGVAVLTPDGALLGTITMPRVPANCAFAGPEGRWLIITARDHLYRVQVPIPGF
jgi:sugar lactone lactonase YvrE